MSTLSTKHADPLLGVVISRAGVPSGLNLDTLPEPLEDAVSTYRDHLARADELRTREGELNRAVAEARAADHEALVAQVRDGKEPKQLVPSREDAARAQAEAHRAKMRAVEQVLDEDEDRLVRVAQASLPEVEARADRVTEAATARCVDRFDQLREDLLERERGRASLTWARAVSQGRPGKFLDGTAAVGDALRGVEALLRR